MAPGIVRRKEENIKKMKNIKYKEYKNIKEDRDSNAGQYEIFISGKIEEETKGGVGEN